MPVAGAAGLCDPDSVELDPKQVARRLEARARKVRATREQEAVRIADLVRREAARALVPGARAWLIGSLAWGGFGPHSDIDVVVEGLSSDRITKLEMRLSESTGRPIEILVLGELPAAFRGRIQGEGIVLHAP
jgi:predicted nucleotidyltransferase